MKNKERKLLIDICDYNENVICSLYDNQSNVSGQATDVVKTTERNGWKELSFSIPSSYTDVDGPHENYRTQYLKADYKIRLIDDEGIDWFIISEPKVTHNSFSKSYHVTAGHISQLLRLKNLGLEFSDDEGNNVGTAKELATAILERTGWKLGEVYTFYEKDKKTEKKRSLRASAKTGAFKLMTMMCELFEAKPVYHGDTRTVDILPINPFSVSSEGELPDLTLNNNVVELHYGKNVSNVQRTLNTENIVTKLYAYGSYGDKTSGYCGIDECTHTEYAFVLNEKCPENQAVYFTVNDDAGIPMTHFFTPKTPINSGSTLIYSLLDPCSMMYIWNETDKIAYPVAKGTVGKALNCNVESSKVKNCFQFVMNYDYYRQVGLFTDDMIQDIAKYQRNAPAIYKEIEAASLKMSDDQTKLSENIGVIDFCKLDASYTESTDGYATLSLNKSKYPDGVIYRTDYDKNKDSYFKWRVTESLNSDGDPINSAAGIVYIIHNTKPLTWDKAYLKHIDNEDNPSELTLWAEFDPNKFNVTDSFYLFSYNGINGHLGSIESSDESAILALEEATRVVTVDHPVLFTDNIEDLSVDGFDGYGWAWQYSEYKELSEFYFCYKDGGDKNWLRVYFQESEPYTSDDSYWFDWRNSVLKKRIDGAWRTFDAAAEKKIAELFATVYMLCKSRDRYYHGLSELYTHTVSGTLPAGNYYIPNEYNSYWAFTTKEDLKTGDTLSYDYKHSWINQIKIKGNIETTIDCRGYRFDNVGYHASNILDGKGLEAGNIDSETGELKDNENSCRMQSLASVIPSTSYTISNASKDLNIYFYDDNRRIILGEDQKPIKVCTRKSFDTPASCSFIRIDIGSVLSDFENEYKEIVIAATYKDDTIVIEDLNYRELKAEGNAAGTLNNIGLVSCITRFKNLSDDIYIDDYQDLKDAQQKLLDLENSVVESVSDLYREGWWQSANYVDGDETKLYDDAVENLNEISKPEATYSISYLHLAQANVDNLDYGASEETVAVKWPNLSITDAVHLIDPDISVNCWAYLDKIQDCYDKPWETKISINTKLSTIGQHSFTDVMTNIANVASEIKGKATYYDKTLNTSASSEDLTKLIASITANEKKFDSKISQAAEKISFEVTRSSASNRETSSLFEQTADMIKTTVSETIKNVPTKDKTISEVIVWYYSSTSNQYLIDGEWSKSVPQWGDGRYAWTKTSTIYADGSTTDSDPVCIAGVSGKNIASIVNYYLISENNTGITHDTDNEKEHWTTEIQTINSKSPFLWNYEQITYTNNTIYKTEPCIIGSYGTAASSMYTWIMYADDETGEGISDDPTDKEYIGILYNQGSPTPSTEKTLYKWSLFRGQDGLRGPGGYTWIKYADDAQGKGISDDPEGKLYIGITCNRDDIDELNDPALYKWSLIKGADGQDGKEIKEIVEWYGTSGNVKVAPADSNWSKKFKELDPTDNKVLWNKEQIIFTEGEDIWTDARVIGVYGDGIKEIIPQYIKTQDGRNAPSKDDEKWSDKMPTDWEYGDYIWIRNKITFTNNSDPQYTTPYCDKSWEVVKQIGKVHIGDDEPSNKNLNDLWIDIKNDANTPKRWNGNEWIEASDSIAVKAESEVKQTKSAISQIVSLGVENDGENIAYAESRLQQTLDSFSVEITGLDKNGNKAESSLKQTVEGLTSTVEDISKKSILQQTADSILASVRTQNANPEANNCFKTSGVSITDEAIDLTVETDGENGTVVSGVKISTDGIELGTNGTFTVSSNKFALEKDGRLIARNATIYGDIYSNDAPVLTTNNIHIGDSAPSDPKVGMIWICPTENESPGGSGGSGDSGIIPTDPCSYFQSPSFDKHLTLTTRRNVTLYRDDTGVAGTGPYTYEATITIRHYKNTNYNMLSGADIRLSIDNDKIVLAGRILLDSNQSSNDGVHTIKATCTSNTWIGNRDSFTAELYAGVVSGYTNGRFQTERYAPITLTCS